MRIEINHAAFDGIGSLSRETVNATTSEQTLFDWYDALTEKGREIATFIEAMPLVGHTGEAAAGKIAYCKIAAKWVEHRMLALGYRVPYPPADPRSRELRRKEERIARLRQQVRDLGGDPDDTLLVAKEIA